MSKIKQNTAAIHVPALPNQRLCRLSAAFLRLWRLYLNTPIGCEITARWIRGENLRK